MTAYTDFHYSPTGSGVISGAQVLEQTEQGINGLGQYVQDNVSGAIDTANQALTTAQSADSNATTAINLANSLNAQIIAANQTAGNALTTAQSAQNTANSASSLATTANNNAATALNTANAASSAVTTLTGTVNSLGNRMTAAENAISANAGNITTLQNNLATTNANVTAAANAASTAQATATSAQSTATLARNQAYVLRYTGTTITGGGTIAYADIDNTDNIKAGDKIIDISGAIYDIASVDTANQTVTVGASHVINLFCDAENLIPSANNSYDLGSSSYQWNAIYANAYYSQSTSAELGVTGGTVPILFKDKNGKKLAGITLGNYGSSHLSYNRLSIYDKDSNNQELEESLEFAFVTTNQRCYFRPSTTDKVNLGSPLAQWNNLYAKNYFYNGTQWGLDQANTWTATNVFTGTAQPIFLRGSSNDIYNVSPQNTVQSLVSFVDKDNVTMSYIAFQHRTDATETHRLCLRQQKITSDGYFGVNLNNLGDFYPEQNNAINLGTSDKKWKTLNGINPGALSLPDTSSSDPIDTTNWNLTGATSNVYTATEDGWISIGVRYNHLTYVSLKVAETGTNGYAEQTMVPNPQNTGLPLYHFVCAPIRAGQLAYITAICSTITFANFYPCQGNV